MLRGGITLGQHGEDRQGDEADLQGNNSPRHYGLPLRLHVPLTLGIAMLYLSLSDLRGAPGLDISRLAEARSREQDEEGSRR